MESQTKENERFFFFDVSFLLLVMSQFLFRIIFFIDNFGLLSLLLSRSFLPSKHIYLNLPKTCFSGISLMERGLDRFLVSVLWSLTSLFCKSMMPNTK